MPNPRHDFALEGALKAACRRAGVPSNRLSVWTGCDQREGAPVRYAWAGALLDNAQALQLGRQPGITIRRFDKGASRFAIIEFSWPRRPRLKERKP